MSNSSINPDNAGNKSTGKRNLPSWMSAKHDDPDKPRGENSREVKKLNTSEVERGGEMNSMSSSGISKLMEGVILVLSGFVNPERGMLRSQAIEMGAEYRPDWNSDCTLLVCNFSNTPKFRQVQADGGTIISKEWITECYSQKKLVDIEPYLLHAGKPWRRSSLSDQVSKDQDLSTSTRPRKQQEKGHSKCSTASSSSKRNRSSSFGEYLLSPSNVKCWAIDDLNKTISWLESQEEKPEADEIKKIAAEGILTCLQDAIDALQNKKDIHQIVEDWKVVPKVVDELMKLEESADHPMSISKEDICKKASDCKRIYEAQYNDFEEDSSAKQKKPKNKQKADRGKAKVAKATEYDSDDTIEMTEEEIELAYNSVASGAPKF